MKQLLLGILLFAAPLLAESEMWIGAGWRQDHLDWSIGVPEIGPDILSELEWKDIRMWQISGGISGPVSQAWYYRLKGDYAKIYQGKNTDSDFLEDGRQSLFSRTENSADKGTAFDFSVALGFPLNCFGAAWEIIPLIGYSRSEQRLRMRNGVQTFDLFFNQLGAFEGLNSRYETKWSSVWAGFDFDYAMACNFSLYGSIEYHYAFYRASGHWNLRSDFNGPFHHDANASGVEAVLGINYTMWNCLGIGIETGYKYYRSEHGVDKTKFTLPEIDEVHVKLNPVTWRSLYVEGNLSYAF